MMGVIRRAVYKMGFRPDYGTVLYSPTQAILKSCEDADITGAFQRGLEQGDQQMMLFDSEAFRTHPTDGTIETLYDRMTFCIFCGATLTIFILDIKECPKGCSRAFPHDDSKGLPVITVEAIGD